MIFTFFCLLILRPNNTLKIENNKGKKIRKITNILRYIKNSVATSAKKTIANAK